LFDYYRFFPHPDATKPAPHILHLSLSSRLGFKPNEQFDELTLRPETVGAQSFAPDSMVKSIPQF